MKTLVSALLATLALGSALGQTTARYPIQPVNRLSHGGPFGGRILSLAADPRDASVLYAGTELGLFKSVDTGASWSVLPLGRSGLNTVSGLFGDSVDGIFISPSNPSLVFASVQALAQGGSPPPIQDPLVRNLYRSDDGGQSWRLFLNDGPLEEPFSVSIAAGYVYVNSQGDGHPLRSTDEGLTYTLLPLLDCLSMAVDPLAPTTVYAAVRSTYPQVDIVSSTNGGDTWEPTLLQGVGAARLHVDASMHRTVYAEGDGLYRSDDGGAHWTANLWPVATPIAAFVPNAGGRSYAASAAGGIYESLDRGTTWTHVGDVPSGILSLAAAGDSLLAGANGDGVFRSDDRGATWTAHNGGLDAAPVDVVVAAPSAPGTAYALSAGFARTTDFGRTWSVDPFAPVAFHGDANPYPATPRGSLAVDPTDSSVVYASGAMAGVLRSDDGGATWSPTFPIETFVMSIAVSPQAPATVYAAAGHIWKTFDRGGSWQQVGGDFPSSAQIVAADPTDPNFLYASDGDFWRSDDSGMSWSRIHTDQELGGSWVSAIVADASHPGMIYALAGGLWKSLDRGTSWTQVQLPAFRGANALAVDARGVVSVGTLTFPTHSPQPIPDTPLRSFDGGETWRPIAPWGVRVGPIGFVSSISADSEGRVYLGTGSNGVWQTTGRIPSTLPSR
jgi:photosystem II stability/assembly factor-like uncharacterized protein